VKITVKFKMDPGAAAGGLEEAGDGAKVRGNQDQVQEWVGVRNDERWIKSAITQKALKKYFLRM